MAFDSQPFARPKSGLFHVKCLSEFLGIEHAKFHSVVMFWGECTFKTPMPENVLEEGYTSYIKSKTEVLFSENEVEQIVDAIQLGRLPATWATRSQHISSLKRRHSEASVQFGKADAGNPSCPRCGSSMLKRLAKSGTNAGNEFWGCSKYPGCRGIVDI